MKATFLIFAGLISSSAFACPDLTGTWICQNSDGTGDSPTVTQAAIPNGMSYTLTSADGQQVLSADGQTRQVNDNGLAGTLVVTCGGNTALTAIENVAGVAGTPDAGLTANLNVTYALTAPGAMTVNGTVTIGAPGQPAQTQTQTTSCSRLPGKR